MDKRAYIIDNIERLDLDSKRLFVQIIQQLGAAHILVDTNIGCRIDLAKLTNLQIAHLHSFISNKIGNN